MLDEREVASFVAGTVQYFAVAAGQPASVGSPYLVTQGAPDISEYTGVITVSGRRQGVVYFTAPRGMLVVMLMKMQESNVAHENLCDLVGEVANTIAGNVRRDFGREFGISPPTVISDGQAVALQAGCHPIVIPINWRSHTAKVVVCLK
jgi:chemotaxis protein CheX